MWKLVKWMIALTFVAGAAWVTVKWYTNRSTISVDALSLIPPDAIYCITTDNPIDAWKQISGSGMWTHLQGNSYFASLTSSANKLDSLIRDNDLLFDLIGSRSLIVSAHMTGASRYDFLFLVDLRQASGIKFLNDYISELSTANLDIQKEKFDEEDLITFHNREDNSNLYASFPGSYLIASYSKEVLLSSLAAYRTDSLGLKNTFLSKLNEVTGDGLMKLYINYEMLPEFTGCYTTSVSEYTRSLSQALYATALNVTLEDDLLKATGHTYINDSLESYIRTLAVSGAGPAEFAEIAPQRTAFALALGFNSFREFFSNFEKIIQEDVADYKTYRQNIRQVEEYLDIDLGKNFIDWIADEVVLLQLQSSGEGEDHETALVFKAQNVEQARKDLAYIEKMVRRKTPVKFKTIDHRGYPVNYLSMKGLFRVLLGKFFARFDKPYYTIINNFVIFSNHPQTLESIIDDYLDKNTLIRSEKYRAFRREFDDESSVFVYLNTPVLFHSLKKLADHATQVSMEDNEEYITAFQQIGFQLVPETTGFQTLLAEQYAAPAPGEDVADAVSVATDSSGGQAPLESAEPTQRDAGSDPMALPYIYVQDLNKTSFKSLFPDSSGVHFEVDLKNGFKDGAFTEYYPTGAVKMKGHFENDKRDGSWRLYDEGGNLILRRTYSNGEIRKEHASN
ncbi:MAG TPA: DUF3352 domain-containing protein [Chryseosolibacter sp.]